MRKPNPLRQSTSLAAALLALVARCSSPVALVALLVGAGLTTGCGERISSPEIRGGQAASRTLLSGGTPSGSVSAGGYHTCAVKTDGTVACWGNIGQGLIASTVPPGTVSIAQVSSGGLFTCALRTDGTVTCWGESSSGQLAVPPSATMVVQIATGYYHACAVREDGTVICWGDNSQNQSGVPGSATSVVQVTGGGYHTCALTAAGAVLCWGYNGAGQSSVPPGATSVVQVAAGFLHTCALRSDGTVVCWGNDTEGQTDVPAAATSVTQISAGQYHTCALRSDGTVICWGSGPQGQIAVPAAATSVRTLTAGLLHTCAGRTDGAVICWGYDGNGQTDVPEALTLIATLPQSIAFTSVAPLAALVGGSYAVAANGGGSGNPVTFMSTTPTICNVSGSFVSFLAPGPCTVAADQAGNADYFAAPQVTQTMSVVAAVQPSTIWLGLKNSDDVGTKFDLQVEIMKNGGIVASGQLDAVTGGSSGFNNALSRVITAAFATAPTLASGDILAVRISVRIAENVSGHVRGTARLWYGDASANSRIETVVNGVVQTLYLQSGFTLSAAAGSGSRSSIDVLVDRSANGNPFKPFGTWTLQ